VRNSIEEQESSQDVNAEEFIDLLKKLMIQ